MAAFFVSGRPERRRRVVLLLGGLAVLGLCAVGSWAFTTWALDETGGEKFCDSCHSMDEQKRPISVRLTEETIASSWNRRPRTARGIIRMTMLKLCVYGYLNRVQSSRRLYEVEVSIERYL